MKLLLSRSSVIALVTLALAGGLLGQAASDSRGQTRVTNGSPAVRVWEERVIIPTYLIGPPEPNPQFYFGGASQGAQQRIYPYPAYDNLTTEKVDKTYKMVYLENEYLKVGVLPEIGGRIFEAIDKTNGYNFFYRQHVIKPALIGLIGAWISGGVEWNIPHHHRATTFLPVQYTHRGNADGSKTVWVGELELRHRMRWAVGLTLRPGKSYLEASFRMVNRTPVPTSMLCFANVAVHVNENYQVIFPPSTQFGTDHAKREFTELAHQQRRRPELVQEHSRQPLHLRLELRGRFLRRLRPRQAGRHDEHRRPHVVAGQEVLHLGQRPQRPFGTRSSPTTTARTSS